MTAHTADALVSQPHSDEAIDFLQHVLAAGPISSKDVQRQAREAGISEVALRRAEATIGVVAGKSGFDAGWCWELPSSQDDHPTAKMVTKIDDHLRPPSATNDHLRDTWQPSEHPDKCRSCTITLKAEEQSVGYCGWCKARQKGRTERKDAS